MQARYKKVEGTKGEEKHKGRLYMASTKVHSPVFLLDNNELKENLRLQR